jgi:aerobic-type carbon monoxide dehydrogenase small subunit (CoxS/CutS family)
MKERIKFTVNGKPVELNTDNERTLLWVLRTDLQLTGTKYGCGESYCGCCMVLLNGKAVQSCQLTLKNVKDKSIVTIEGLAENDKPNPLQKAFMENDALQCGYCTPGMIIKAWALLKRNPNPTDKQIMATLEDNLCRCGAHKRIIDAVHAAAKEMGGL